MAEISISRELIQDLSAFYPSAETLLVEKFRDQGITVDNVVVRPLFADDILQPALIRVNTGEVFEMKCLPVGPNTIDFVLEKAK